MQKMTSNLWDGDKMHYWPVMYYQGFACLFSAIKRNGICYYLVSSHTLAETFIKTYEL